MQYIFIILILLVILIWFPCHEAARSYNKLCQPDIKATTWDAMWVDLKVDACRIGKNIK